jgi:hypothetical protein
MSITDGYYIVVHQLSMPCIVDHKHSFIKFLSEMFLICCLDFALNSNTLTSFIIMIIIKAG